MTGDPRRFILRKTVTAHALLLIAPAEAAVANVNILACFCNVTEFRIYVCPHIIG